MNPKLLETLQSPMTHDVDTFCYVLVGMVES